MIKCLNMYITQAVVYRNLDMCRTYITNRDRLGNSAETAGTAEKSQNRVSDNENDYPNNNSVTFQETAGQIQATIYLLAKKFERLFLD